ILFTERLMAAWPDAAATAAGVGAGMEIFHPNCAIFFPCRHDDLKEMLDSNKDSLKLEAMKRIVAMIARGKNASDLFPAVVKNVACKNIEVKKLVYVYLVRYAEEQQDLALLSISTFQRGLKDPNQLIRASALRVLSSIRVTIIVPIMMLAIKEAASDMSPYVRKTAAHAIPKLYRCASS
uniref:Adaptor related protein complex 3 subunit beta 2 n=1 Tax=Hippocampus comes TaxID=109280 RepID=A0A3Q2XMG1_HIPCM